jgi:hypothetical protein
VEQPWLVVHGDADTSVAVDDGRALFEAAGDDAELLVVEGADHTFGTQHPFTAAGDHFRTAAGATLDFFGAHLRGDAAPDADGEGDEGDEGEPAAPAAAPAKPGKGAAAPKR